MKTKFLTVSDQKNDSSDTSFQFEKCGFATDQQNPKKANLNPNQMEDDNLNENTGSTNDYCDFEDANLKEFEVDFNSFDKDDLSDARQQKLFKTAPLETFIFF